MTSVSLQVIVSSPNQSTESAEDKSLFISIEVVAD